MEVYAHVSNMHSTILALMEHDIECTIPTPSETQLCFKNGPTVTKVKNKCALIAYMTGLALLTFSDLDEVFINNTIIEIAQCNGDKTFHTRIPPKKMYNPETQRLNDPTYERMSFFGMLFHPEAEMEVGVINEHAKRHNFPVLVRNTMDGSETICGTEDTDYRKSYLFIIETDNIHFRLVFE